jgi:MFS family permease
MATIGAQALDVAASNRSPGRSLRHRLLPLYVAVFLQGLALWVPIEKLFMTSIGFDPASIGVMAAVYAGVVPVFEIPSGVLADRWSRRGVLVLAGLAAIVSVIVGGLSQNVLTYMVAAVFLGLFFAMQSGTLDSLVYDTVLDETGDSESFEHTIGRLRLVESIALVASALAGGVIAQFLPLPVTYFLTAPLLLVGCAFLHVFREPRLHKAEESESLRSQVGATVRTILQRGRLRLVVVLTVLSALIVQGMLEFGPLWLVALAVPAFLYGPHWAGLTAALGVGGVIGSWSGLTSRWGAALMASAIVAFGVVLALSDHALVVVGAQIALVLLVIAVGIPVLRALHDAVPSSIRAGVASGVSTLTWLMFVPFAIAMGFVTDRLGVSSAGWMTVAVAIAAGLLLVVVLPRTRLAEPAAAAEPTAEVEPTFPPDRFLPEDAPEWGGHWASPPRDWQGTGLGVDRDIALAEVRAAVRDMPPELRRAIVARDVRGDAVPGTAAGADDERELLHRARGQVRSRLEERIEGRRQ